MLFSTILNEAKNCIEHLYYHAPRSCQILGFLYVCGVYFEAAMVATAPVLIHFVELF